MRVCKDCNVEKPETEFYKKALNRLATNCKSCHIKKAAEWKAKNKEKMRLWYRDYCRKAYAENPEKYREKARIARLKDPEKKRLACRKSYRKKQANLDDAEKERRRKNAISWRAKNIEKCRLAIKNHRMRYPHKHNAKQGGRRASKAQATPAWLTFIELAQIKEIYDLSIAVSVQTGILHHVDHIVPLRGKNVTGLHVPWNLRIIPADENIRKNNKLMES